MVVSDGASKVGLFKIRPRLGAEIQLGVGGLPEQEVGQALFARRANDEIGVRNWIGHEGRGKAHLVDFLRMEIAGNHSSGQRPGCHDNLLPRTVVQRQAEVEASAGSCGFFGHLEIFKDSCGYAISPAQCGEADAFLYQLLPLFPKIPVQKGEEYMDLLGRSLPVLVRECKEGQHRDTLAAGFLGSAPHGAGSSLMPFPARHPALLRPPAVSVHNDSHMLN